MNKQLGRLEKNRNIRDIWDTEDKDFTPWLAEQGNITLLGDAQGLSLEVEAQEKAVGPFRADILCKDTADDSWVLVENQLERTDHKHLGQLMTYASGLKAVTIVWISTKFTEEHRSSLDWLNQITDDSLISWAGNRVVEIGDSLIAPKFNIISETKRLEPVCCTLQNLQNSIRNYCKEITGRGSMIFCMKKAQRSNPPNPCPSIG